jgi:mono/diheme cytochrome c family protein
VAGFATIPPDVTPAEWMAEPTTRQHPGFKPFQNECTECHTMGDPGKRDDMLQPAPDLFAWGSERWISRMIRHPGSANLYGYLEDEQKMPASEGQLTQADLDTLIRYLKGDYFLPRPMPSEASLATSP